MKKFLSKSWPWGLTLAFGVAVWLFWAVAYPHALAFREQFQLFLFDSDYFSGRMAQPGGLARWVAEFLTQFFNNKFFGATVIALLLMMIQRQTWLVFKGLNKSWVLYPFSFIPAIMLWYAMGDEMLLLAFAVALLLVLIVCWAIEKANLVVAVVVAVIGMPLLYWFVGPLALMTAVFMAFVLPLKKRSRLAFFGTGVLAVVMVVLSIVISSHLLPYPIQQLWIGLGYYRLPLTLPLMMLAIPVVVLVLAVICIAVGGSKHKESAHSVITGALTLGVAALCVILVPNGFDAKKYEIIDYDYLVRTGQWKKVIQKAEQQQPDLPMSVAATNLALAMENQLGERAFQFYQRGTQGLIPPFERNYATTMLTGEVFFRLGLVNTAQRYAFEAMEANPNYEKSARAIKRLAETNLINGQYEVARKYLHLLEKTLFYRKWAQKTLTLISSEAQIDAHPLYGYLRKVRLTDELLFSDREIDKFCGKLFLQNQQNTIAMQYLLMWPLLQRDVALFMNYVGVVQEHVQYNPLHVQEGICYAFGQQRTRPPRNLVSDAMTNRFVEFVQAYNGGNQDPVRMQAFKNTVWYYLVNEQ